MKKIDDLFEIINERKNIKVTELEKISMIPRTSLLRYLKQLENKGKVIKEFGEVAIRRSSIESNAIPRIHSSKKEKIIIAKIASKKIKDGSVIFLDAGSTTYYLALELHNKKIIIYTNNIILSNIINNSYVPEVYFLPGKINHKTLSISSAETIFSLKDKKFDQCFIGVNSFNKKTFFTTNQEEAIVKKAAILSTKKNGAFILGRSAKSNESAQFAFSSYELAKLITEKGGA